MRPRNHTKRHKDFPMPILAERMSRIDASGIRKIFAMAATMKDPVNLSIGQPDYDVDTVV